MNTKEPIYIDTEYRCGTKCIICGTKRKPIAGRCIECGYMWARSELDSKMNWQNYTDVSYRIGKELIN